jgi:hypothetical protein
MSQLETLREHIEIMKSMAQPVRHNPIIIAPRISPSEMLYLRRTDGSYARDERGFLMHDQMATYKANRSATPPDYSLDDLKFTDYVKVLTELPVSDFPRRQIPMSRRRSPYESAKWQGFRWGGRTNASATEWAIRRAIQKTFPKAKPYLVKSRYPRMLLGKSIAMSNLCHELFGTGNYYGLTVQQRKQQEIIDARFNVDFVRLSTQLAASYPQLPIDGRFTPSYETLEKFYVPEQSSVYHSTGHWDKRKY